MSAKKFLMMAMAMAVMSGTGMSGYGDLSRSSYEPNIPEEKKILPGKFKGTIPKGCKLHTEAIETKHRGYLLTKNVDIVYGSEKAKQKAIVKAANQIKEYLKFNHSKDSSLYIKFDKVEELPKEVPMDVEVEIHIDSNHE